MKRLKKLTGDAMSDSALGIGSTVWIFDENHRVYVKGAGHFSAGHLIYREHWRPTNITSETRVSWVLDGLQLRRIPCEAEKSR